MLLQLILTAASPAVAAPTVAAASAAAASFAASAHAVRAGGQLHVTNFKLEGDFAASTLQLTRFEVFTPDAQVCLVGACGTDQAVPCPAAPAAPLPLLLPLPAWVQAPHRLSLQHSPTVCRS